MTKISFADVVHQSLSFSRDIPADALILELADAPWVQRLRDVSQTANTRLVYMFSEHSRFGHSLGAAYLAKLLLEKLSSKFPKEVEAHRIPVCAAALLHDLGHLAPGSHTAFKTWFPGQHDAHEQLTVKIVSTDPVLGEIFSKYGSGVKDAVCRILEESPQIPPWTWELISGGGWNIDRGNWCIVDSIMAGVSYGHYNIPALTDSMTITSDGHLALNENRLDAMTHFVMSRHAMYRQVYQHRVLLAADTLDKAVVRRARELEQALPFSDSSMKEVLNAKDPLSLSTDTVFQMRESWWRYHLHRWAEGRDKILSDLSSRIINRRLFKTVRLSADSAVSLEQAREAVKKAGYSPDYYLHQIQTSNLHSGDRHQSMLVLMDTGKLKNLSEAEPLFDALVNEDKRDHKVWLAMPEEAKRLLSADK